MADNSLAKKWLVGGVVAAVILAVGGWYYYSHTAKKPAANEHAGHQTAGGASVAVSGDAVKLDAKARQLAGVQTATVGRKDLAKEIRTTGKLALNETSRSYITSRVEGRVEELFINAEGEYIAPGQPIAAVYSPNFIAAQEEYLLALDNVSKLRLASRDIVQLNNKLLEASKRKLVLLGIPEADIEHLAHTRKVNTVTTVRAQYGGTVMEKAVLPGAFIMPGDKLYTLSDLSTVWLNADLYEKDIAGVRVGQQVQVTSVAYPGQVFGGVVTFINPVVEDATRTVKVRVEMPNPEGKLKPNMFVDAAVRVPLGEGLAIPVSSLLDTGTRKIVFVAQSEDTFVKRDIVTGQEADGYIQVLSGLQPGEVVVTGGAFLIDSQTQLGNFGSHAGHGSGNKQSGAGTPAAQQAPAQAPAKPAQPAGQGHEHSGH